MKYINLIYISIIINKSIKVQKNTHVVIHLKVRYGLNSKILDFIIRQN